MTILNLAFSVPSSRNNVQDIAGAQKLFPELKKKKKKEESINGYWN